MTFRFGSMFLIGIGLGVGAATEGGLKGYSGGQEECLTTRET
jgi:hypothetical protein